MNAMVWKIMVEPGQMVVEDEILVVLESMKMEIPVMSPSKGRVVDIKVAEGDSVGEDQVIMVVEES
jgi:biotin carboxyl carrier protein